MTAIAKARPNAKIIVVQLAGGLGTDLYHLPTPTRRAGTSTASLDELDFPDVWSTLCGLEGGVFENAGAMVDRRLCAVCGKRAPKGDVVRPRKPRPGSKPVGMPKGKYRKITDVQIRALHLLHWEQRVSINEIAKRYHEQLGYSSHRSFCSGLCQYFKEFGLPTHDRIEMTVAASTKHGQCRRNAKSSDKKRFLAQRRGDQYDKPCGAKNARGKACRVRAMTGKDFCQFHDPSQRERWVAATAAMRAIYQLHDPATLEPAGPTAELLRAYRAGGGTWRDLSRRTDIPDPWLGHVAHGTQERVDKRRAQLIRDALLPVELAGPPHDVDDGELIAA